MSELQTSLGRMTALRAEVKKLNIWLEASRDANNRCGNAFRAEAKRVKELEKQNEYYFSLLQSQSQWLIDNGHPEQAVLLDIRIQKEGEQT